MLGTARFRTTASASCLLAAAALGGCGGSDHREHVTIAVHAPSELIDSPVRIEVRGLARGQRATLRARWRARGGAVWTSTTPLRAGAGGAVRLSGVSGMRFLWAMRPADRARSAPSFGLPLGRSLVALSVVDGGRTLAHASVARRVITPSVRVRPLTVAHDGVRGVLFRPTSGQPAKAAVVAFGGSEGGNGMLGAAGLLAAHGHPALALAYFRAPGLPRRLARIPLEYFARAARIVGGQPGADRRRVVTMGVSRGGEASLLLAATFPRLLHGAIALVPSASVLPAPDGSDPAWTYRGRPVPRGPIAVERIRGPVLAAGAGMDAVWHSAAYVRTIARRLAARHFPFAYDARVYGRAGHLLGGAVPYRPPPVDQAHFGGSPEADAAAKADLWPRILRYLDRL